MNIIAYIFLLSLLEALAIYNIKLHSKYGNSIYIIIVGILYFIIAVIFSYAVKESTIVNINIYWNIVSTILTLFIGYYFNEYLSISNIIGIGFCMVGVIIMNL